MMNVDESDAKNADEKESAPLQDGEKADTWKGKGI